MRTSFLKKQWAFFALFALVFAVSSCSNGKNSNPVQSDDTSEIESTDSGISSEDEEMSSGASSSSKGKVESSSSSFSSSSSSSSDDEEKSSSSKGVSSSSKGDSNKSSAKESSSSFWPDSSYLPHNRGDFDLDTCETEGLISYFLKNKKESVARICKGGVWVEMESSSSTAPKSSNDGTPSTCKVEHYKMDDHFNSDIEYKEFEDTRDGKTYKTVEVEGTLPFEVFAENLNYGVQVRGLKSDFDDAKIEKFCLEDDPWYCDNGFGGLYSWSEAMGLPKACDYVETGSTAECPNPVAAGASTAEDWAKVQVQGICPDGWHIMNEYEWSTLAGGTYVGDLISKMFGNRDDYGFSAMLGGLLNTTGKIEYQLAPKYGFIWLPQEKGAKTAGSIAFTRSLWDKNFDVSYKTDGMSIRCVKNYKEDNKG